PEGMRFLSRGRAFTAAERASLDGEPPLRGDDYASGRRPPAQPGQVLVSDAVQACRVPPDRGTAHPH
ncbi:MAG: DUF779 domain-containing protein, partial [Mycobacteriaceae bacterium]|nr:DUF779 domain-containing protein [Mycobacteriaceae bacterium]